MKRLISSLLAIAVIVSGCILQPASAEAAVGKSDHTTVDFRSGGGWPEAPEIGAQSAYMVELNTGTVLYDKNGDDQAFPASTTKTLTAYLALQNLDLDREVTFSRDSVTDIETGGSHREFKEGEVLSVDECLQFLLVESVNECGYALAEEMSGSIQSFADLMNQTAASFGATNTHFNNPHGLNDPNHYSTAHDMAMVLWGCVQDERFQQYASIRKIALKGRKIQTRGFTSYVNHHLMLDPTSEFYDADVVCGKTGFTSIAGSTLVTYAHRGDMDVVCVIMKGEDSQRFLDTKNLLDYAFDKFELIAYENADGSRSAGLGENMDPGTEFCDPGYVLTPKGTAATHITSEFVAESGDDHVIGTRTWFYDGTKVGSSRVKLTDEAVRKLSERKAAAEAWRVSDEANSMSERSNRELIVIFLIGGAILLLLFVVIGMIRANNRRKRAAARRRARARKERMERARQAGQYSRSRDPHRRDRRY